MSSMVKVAVVLVLLPQASVAVKITVAEPVAPQLDPEPVEGALRALKSLLQLTAPQLSEAEAPPLVFSQSFRAAVLPAPSHSTVASPAVT